MCRTLSHKYPKVQRVSNDEMVDGVIHAIVSESSTEKQAESAMRRFAECFVDWNDLRVSRAEEIVEVLGSDTPATRSIASTIIRVLTSIFNEYHRISLEALRKLGKRPARQVLEKIDGISRFAIDYCMLTSLRGHAVPLTQKMVEYLKNNDLVDPEADEQEIEGFLAKQIPAKNGFEFYALLRRESEAADGGKMKKATSPKADKTKSAAKKKEKK